MGYFIHIVTALECKAIKFVEERKTVICLDLCNNLWCHYEQ